jgi:hypothetical protein
LWRATDLKSIFHVLAKGRDSPQVLSPGSIHMDVAGRIAQWIVESFVHSHA